MDGFWQNGIAIESMANAMKYGNHSRYLSVVKVYKSSKPKRRNMFLRPTSHEAFWHTILQ